MTTGDLLTRLLDHFHYDVADAGGSSRRRLLGHLDQWHRRILSSPGLASLRRATTTVTSTASQPVLVLPEDVARIIAITDRTNDERLTERSLDWYRTAEPDPSSTTGTPTCYVAWGRCSALPIATACGLWAVSSSASDVCRASVEGVLTSGYRRTDTVAALTGTSRVAIGSATTWEAVYRFWLDVAAVGTVSLYDAAAAGNVVAVIPAQRRESAYESLRLWPTPASAVTYYLDYERKVPSLANDSDVPLLETDAHWLLEQGAKVSEYERLDDSRLTVARVELERGLNAYRFRLASSLDSRPGGSAGVGRSRLGAWYPADRTV